MRERCPCMLSTRNGIPRNNLVRAFNRVEKLITSYGASRIIARTSINPILYIGKECSRESHQSHRSFPITRAPLSFCNPSHISLHTRKERLHHFTSSIPSLPSPAISFSFTNDAPSRTTHPHNYTHAHIAHASTSSSPLLASASDSRSPRSYPHKSHQGNTYNPYCNCYPIHRPALAC